jgi:hypothetical protein
MILTKEEFEKLKPNKDCLVIEPILNDNVKTAGGIWLEPGYVKKYKEMWQDKSFNTHDQAPRMGTVIKVSETVGYIGEGDTVWFDYLEALKILGRLEMNPDNSIMVEDKVYMIMNKSFIVAVRQQPVEEVYGYNWYLVEPVDEGLKSKLLELPFNKKIVNKGIVRCNNLMDHDQLVNPGDKIIIKGEQDKPHHVFVEMETYKTLPWMLWRIKTKDIEATFE